MRSGGLRSAARAAARRADWSSAARNYEALVQAGGARAGDRIQLGHALKELGDTDAALHAYGEAARLHPLHVDAQRQYALYLRRLRREPEALDVLARALAIAPATADIEAEIADMDVADDATRDRHFLRGILGGSDAAPQDRPGLIGRALAYWSLGRARKHARARDWASAEAHYRDVLRYAPDWINPRTQLGHALLEQGRPADALAAYRRALVVAPRAPDLYLHVGHALKLLGRRAGALEAYLTAWRLKPGFALAFDEARSLRPDIDKAALLSDGGVHAIGDRAGGGSRASHDKGRERLAPPHGLNDRQTSVFKFLAGSISYKD